MKRIQKTLTAIMVTTLVASCTNPTDFKREEKTNRVVWPKINSEVKQDLEIENKVSELLSKMTLEQKVAQMIQPEIRDITVEDMRRYGFGSYLNGGGAFPNNNKHSSIQDWVDLAEAMYQASVDDSLDGINIPTMWGTDAVHGHNNVIGATLFPHNIGLGAANNPDLLVEIAEITAKEVMATGIDWVFAPTVATVRDDRWGRTYEGYSEDPEIVRKYAAAIVHGLQGKQGDNFLGDDRVISTVKHFVGDGGTVKGDDQGDNIDSEQSLLDIHAQGYIGALTAGAQTVMASFNSWNGKKIHGSKYLLTDVLKKKMGFDGFVVGDWNGHGQILGCSNDDCPQAVNAGLDVYMVPTSAWKPLMENTIRQVKLGIIPISRIDDAVTRILRVKFRAGIFDKVSPAQRPYANRTDLIGHPKHRKVAKKAVRESLVLLKNNQILPLSPRQHFLIAGDAANNIGKQSGGWTITWQGTNNENSDFPGGTSIYDGFAKQIKEAGGSVILSEDGSFDKKPDVAIVVFGEEPYAEGHGDRENLVYQQGNKRDLALLQKLKGQGIPVVSIFISGRPLWVNPELNASDAFVAAWLPGSEGDAVADVILRDQAGNIQNDFKGKLSFSWPNHSSEPVNRFDKDYAPLLPYGFGLQYGDDSVLTNSLNEKVELDANLEGLRYIFKGKVESPWHMGLFSGEDRQSVISSSVALNGLEYRTIDRHIQEDAFKLFWNGKENAGMEIVSKNWFREDLSSMQALNAALVFKLMRDGRAEKPLIISSHCESEGDRQRSCSANVDITEEVNKLPDTQWQELSIDLKCFANQGLIYSQVIMPFAISTSGRATISISDIHFAPNHGNMATISCE